MGQAGGWRADELRMAAHEPSAEALETARFGFATRQPHRSARRVLYFTQGAALCLIGAGLFLAARAYPDFTSHAAHAALFALFTVAILWRLFAAASLAPIAKALYPADSHRWPTYTILCPLHREANVVADLIAALERLDYPKHALDIQ